MCGLEPVAEAHLFGPALHNPGLDERVHRRRLGELVRRGLGSLNRVQKRVSVENLLEVELQVTNRAEYVLEFAVLRPAPICELVELLDVVRVGFRVGPLRRYKLERPVRRPVKPVDEIGGHEYDRSRVPVLAVDQNAVVLFNCLVDEAHDLRDALVLRVEDH